MFILYHTGPLILKPSDLQSIFLHLELRSLKHMVASLVAFCCVVMFSLVLYYGLEPEVFPHPGCQFGKFLIRIPPASKNFHCLDGGTFTIASWEGVPDPKVRVDGSEIPNNHLGLLGCQKPYK